MRKLKPPPAPASPKRKRARRMAPDATVPIGGKIAGERQYTDEDIRRICRRAERDETPRVFAVVARQLGFVAARPRDFFCHCLPHYRTGVPDCAGEIDGCPHAGRLSPEVLAASETPQAQAQLMARIKRVIAARAAQR